MHFIFKKCRRRFADPPGIASMQPNTLSVFKWTTIFLLACLCTRNAHAQKVTLQLKKSSIVEALKAIRKQTGYSYFIKAEQVKKAKPVTVSIANATLQAALDRCFEAQPLAYTIIDKAIIVKDRPQTSTRPAAAPISTPSDKTIRGLVTDSIGNPLAGVNVTEKGSQRGTTTMMDGSFTITYPQSGELVFSLVGFAEKEVQIGERSYLNITLQASESQLDEVQVIAYGTTTRRLNTGSVSKVSNQVIGQQPVTNVLGALAGRMPGVFVETENGLPGGQIKVQIRGRQSLAAGTDPLFVVDGVPFSSTSLTIGTSDLNFLNGPVSPLNSISPDDIASIEVLKDADATALYGARGANGVILITTKRGVKGAPAVSIIASQGFSKISRKADFLNLSQYLMLRREAFKNENAIPSADPLNTNYAPDLLVWDTTKSRDWQDYTFGGTAPLTKIQTSISGGNESTKFLLGLNYLNEGSVMQGKQEYGRYGGHLTVNHLTANQKFNVQAMVNYTKDDNQTLKQLNAVNTYNLPPNFNPYLADGSLDWTLGSNPEAYLKQEATNKTDNLITNLTLGYQLLRSLSLKVSAGYTTTGMESWSKDPASAQNPTASEAPVNRAYFGNQRTSTFLIEPQLSYQENTRAGDFTGLLGFSYQRSDRKSQALTGTNYINELFLENLGAAGQVSYSANQYSQYKYASVFLRVGYNYQKKYLLNVNIRRDGSSRFGPDNQFGNFGAIGAGWILSEERFMKVLTPVLSFAKLRGSWGVVGNDQIPDYQFLSTYGNSPVYLGIRTLSPDNISNVNYRWEATQKGEGALELGFFDNRLNLITAFFSHRSNNQLVAFPIPFTSGPFVSYQANRPALILNSGWEIELSAQLLKKKSITWDNSFNITLPSNVLKKYPGLSLSPYANQYIIGEDLSNTKTYWFDGIDPVTGIAKAKDVNGDGVISFPSDLAGPRGKISPDFFGGWSNQIRYKSFSLDVFFQFVKQAAQVDRFLFWPPGGLSNKLTTALGRWQLSGDITDVPRAYLPSNRSVSDIISYVYNSDISVMDASYIRLKNIALRYNLPSWHTKRIKISGLEVFLLAQNLITWSPVQVLDPEVSTFLSGVPTLKSIVFGLSVRL